MTRCATDLCNDSEGDIDNCPNCPEAPIPDGICLVEDLACEIADDNLVGMASGVSNITECLEDATAYNASHVTYFGPNGFPFVDSCLYFNACDILGEKFRYKVNGNAQNLMI